MNPFRMILATAEDPCPNPPTTGHWLRDAAGNLIPADEATARAAGLLVETTDEQPTLEA